MCVFALSAMPCCAVLCCAALRCAEVWCGGAGQALGAAPSWATPSNALFGCHPGTNAPQLFSLPLPRLPPPLPRPPDLPEHWCPLHVQRRRADKQPRPALLVAQRRQRSHQTPQALPADKQRRGRRARRGRDRARLLSYACRERAQVVNLGQVMIDGWDTRGWGRSGGQGPRGREVAAGQAGQIAAAQITRSSKRLM